MGIDIEEVAKNKWFDSDIMNKVPTVCPGCGERIEFTDNLRNIRCTNNKCYYKIARRLKNMLKSLKIKSLTEEECKELCKEKQMISPFQILLLHEYSFDKVENFGNKLNEIKDKLNTNMYLWEMVEIADIPSISNIAKKIFDGYCNIDEAYEDIESMEVPYIANKLGLCGDASLLVGVDIYNKLVDYKDELKFAESKLNIIEDDRIAFRMVVRGNIDGFINKSDYINWLNTKYSDKVAFIVQGCVTESTNILVDNTNTLSNESRIIEKLNEVSEDKEIKILTSKEFNEFLETVYKQLSGVENYEEDRLEECSNDDEIIDFGDIEDNNEEIDNESIESSLTENIEGEDIKEDDLEEEDFEEEIISIPSNNKEQIIWEEDEDFEEEELEEEDFEEEDFEEEDFEEEIINIPSNNKKEQIRWEEEDEEDDEDFEEITIEL